MSYITKRTLFPWSCIETLTELRKFFGKSGKSKDYFVDGKALGIQHLLTVLDNKLEQTITKI